MRSTLAFIIGCIFLGVGAPVAAQSLTSFVNPFIGTDGSGHTFPGPARPFGMVQPGPDNADRGWDYTSGYQYRAPRILGFSQTRASGTGIPELGDVLLQPGLEPREDMASTYDKTTESARPGYYAVELADNGVRVELTTGERVARHRYTFARPGRVWVLVDLQHGLNFMDRQPVLSSEARVTGNGVEGVSRRRNWTTRTVAFVVEFDRPVAEARRLAPRAGDLADRYLLGFDVGDDRTLEARAALSTTDVAGARRNLESEQDRSFNQTAAEADAAWEAMLSRIRIEAPDSQKRIFYSALYRALIHPSLITDADGRWRGPDGEIRQADGPRYSTLSLWDTFRASHPLFTLVAPEWVDDFVNSLLDHADAAGRLPMWTIWGGETGTMIGEPALPVIADAWAKGFRGFDPDRALDAMIRTQTEDHHLSEWSILDRYGYLPFDRVEGEAVSRTLEAGIGDDALARFARARGRDEIADRFAARSRSWRALIDPETRLPRGRNSEGHWRTPFDPLKPTSPLNNPGDYTEANAWQYLWTPALFDAEGLRDTLGGPAAFAEKLDTFFFGLPPTEGAAFLGQEAMIGQYAHGNEPSHHVAWLYALTDRPGTGQALVRHIAESFYLDQPDGVIGNDDAGQMSAWYVFATLGLYPAEPSSGRYVLGAPLVEQAVIDAPGVGPLTIRCETTPVATPYDIAHEDLIARRALALPCSPPPREGAVTSSWHRPSQ
ncbi:GH92 family glycosyl hydrolase [Brevundimonas subvibrioides]|uniref:GH92 family glycosyl hydrolase n=1 Tax=Brevundimonas subvibrioides TaxID=74313 RepID=UPI0022B2D432|nr:GH92 family glycosyl hydrolase [Brevundimonas subvibrioides]